ncbi:MAG: glycosyltransferase family 2 protein [Cyanobacteria bacterium J06623_7]
MKPIVLNPDFATTRMAIAQPSNQDPAQQRQTAGGLRTQGYVKQSYPGTPSSSSTEKKQAYPLVSIITVVYNNVDCLTATMESVLKQSYDNLEYIIVDGGSTDGTLELIRQYADRIDYWVSEPDNGLYDAMNKGIALATGDIIGILNSDDLYYPNTVTQIVEQYRQTGSSGVIYGSMAKFIAGNETIVLTRGDLSDRAFETASILINHPTCFVPRQLYENFGGFKPEYEVGADRELMMRFQRQGVTFINLERAIAQFRLGGTTSNESLAEIFQREVIQEYRLLSAYRMSKIIIARVIAKKLLQGGRKWLFYRVLGEKLTGKIIMFYLNRKFSRSSEKLTPQEHSRQ